MMDRRSAMKAMGLVCGSLLLALLLPRPPAGNCVVHVKETRGKPLCSSDGGKPRLTVESKEKRK